MGGVGDMLTILSALLVNECSDVSPWVARRLMRWATRLRYRDQPERLAVRLRELPGLMQERPGKLLQLLMALQFACASVLLVVGGRQRRWVRQLVSRGVRPLFVGLVPPWLMAFALGTSIPVWPFGLLGGIGAAAVCAVIFCSVPAERWDVPVSPYSVHVPWATKAEDDSTGQKGMPV